MTRTLSVLRSLGHGVDEYFVALHGDENRELEEIRSLVRRDNAPLVRVVDDGEDDATGMNADFQRSWLVRKVRDLRVVKRPGLVTALLGNGDNGVWPAAN